MKKLIYIIITQLAIINTADAGWKDYIKIGGSSGDTTGSYEDKLVPSEANTALDESITNSSADGAIGALSDWIVSTLFGVLVVCAIAVFIYLGTKLIMARGNEEEFGKVMKGFLYSILGLFLISAAYAIVIFVTNVSI